LTEPPWRLEGFLARFVQWITDEEPSRHRREVVYSWIASLNRGDPTAWAIEALALGPDSWFIVIPGTSDGVTAVVCSYVLNQTTRAIAAGIITTLPLPIEPPASA